MKKALIFKDFIEILYFVLVYLTIFYFWFWCPGRDSNSHACWARDFESLVSTISPPRHFLCGAGKRSRTSDLRITNALLYQLSYTGTQEMRLYRKRLFCAMLRFRRTTQALGCSGP